MTTRVTAQDKYRLKDNIFNFANAMKKKGKCARVCVDSINLIREP